MLLIIGAPRVQAASYPLSYTVNRSQAPPLYYQDLTYLVKVNQGTAVVTANGQTISNSYLAASDQIMFTTPASTFTVTVTNPTSTTNLGVVQKATLKDNKHFAWSEGMDDNTYLKNEATVLENYGWRGTFYLIGNIVDSTRNEDWIVDLPYLAQKLNIGWAIGNHTWDHECTSPNLTTVTQGYNRVKDIVDASSLKNSYLAISFAAPCVNPTYNPIIQSLKNTSAEPVQFDEGQGLGSMSVEPGAFDFSAQVNRDPEIDNTTPQLAIDRLNTMNNTYNSAGTHLWYNTLTHGSKETPLNTVAAFAYTTYGPGGNNVLWMAPAEVIYSYLLTRDKSVVTLNGGPTPTITTTPTPIIIPTLTPTPNPNGPQITIANSSGVAGNQVGIFGSNFGVTQGTSSVKIINQTAQILEWRDTFIKAVIPSDTDNTDDVGTIQVTVNGQSNTWAFTRYHVDPKFLKKPLDLTNISLINSTTGKQVYFSGVTTNDWNLTNPTTTLARNNNDFGGLYITLGNNSNVAVDLGQPVSGPVWFSFYGGTDWYTTTAAPATYQIQGSANSTNGQDGTWDTLLSITGNQHTSRSHQIITNNHRWLRLHVTATAGAAYRITEIRVHQAAANAVGPYPDSLLVFGDSITYADLGFLRDDQFFVSMLNTLRGNTTHILSSVLGLAGAKSDKLSAPASDPYSLTSALAINPEPEYWGFAFGTNDSQDPASASLFKGQVDTGIQQLITSGKTPLLARIPDTDEAMGGYGNLANKLTILKAIDALNVQYHLLPGPDLYTPFHYNILFQNSSYIRSGDGTHHSDAGSVMENQLWAQAMYNSGIYTGTSPLVGDLDLDGDVDTADFVLGIKAYGNSGGNVDLNHDGIVNSLDLAVIMTKL